MIENLRTATCARCGHPVARVRFDVHGDVACDIDLSLADLDTAAVAAAVVTGRTLWRVETSTAGVRAGRWGWATADRAAIGVESVTVQHKCGDRWPLPAWWNRVTGLSVVYPEYPSF